MPQKIPHRTPTPGYRGSIAIVAPNDGDEVYVTFTSYGNVSPDEAANTMSAFATDANGNVTEGTRTTVTPYEWAFAFSVQTPGPYTLLVRAYDYTLGPPPILMEEYRQITVIMPPVGPGPG